MSAYHIECWNSIHPEASRIGFSAKFPSRCTNRLCSKGGTIAVGDKMWGEKQEQDRGRFNNRRSPSETQNGKSFSEMMSDIRKEESRMQEAPAPFKVGDEVRCVHDDGSNLIKGAVYTVRGMLSTLNGWEVRLENVEGDWASSRFRSVQTEQPATPATPSPVNTTGDPDEMVSKAADAVVSKLAPIVASLVKDTVKSQLDRDTMVANLAADVLAKVTPKLSTIIEVKNLDTGKTQSMGIQHKQFPLLLKTVQARVPVWIAGPSGSGKTSAAMNVAEALGMPFRYSGAVGDPYALIGYNDANGRYVRTEFREAYENGGLFLWDEVDASDPNALLAFNAALANGTCPFPDGTIKQHKDCVMIAAANTWGHGATQEYVGRLKMDAAFLKRFAFIAWDYDEQMEMNTAPNRVWTMRVQKVRKAVRDSGLRVLVTPRESYLGARLLAVGIDQNTVEEMTIKSGMTSEQWAKVRYA